MKWLQSLIFGLMLPIHSFWLILKKPKLLFWSILPVILCLFAYGFFIVKTQTLVHFLSSQLPAITGLQAEHWINTTFTWTARIIVFLTTAFVSALSFSGFANLLSCPLNDFLAEATEAYSSPPLKKTNQLPLNQRLKVLSIDFMKTLFILFSQIILIFFHWLPFVNIVSLVLTFLLMSFQYISYPQTRRGLGLIEGLSFLKKHFFSCLGFGASITFLLSIPWISCFFIPLAVVSGTLLFGRAQNKTLK